MSIWLIVGIVVSCEGVIGNGQADSASASLTIRRLANMASASASLTVRRLANMALQLEQPQPSKILVPYP